MRALVASALLLVPSLGAADSAGIAGFSGQGGGPTCAQCHTGGTAPTSVTISGPGTLVTGETATYDIAVVSGATTQKSAGVDVAASAGTLAVHAGAPATRLANGEIVHSGTAAGNGTVTFHFDFTAPGQAGAVTLFGDGLAANGDGVTGGDASLTTMFTVTVSAPPPDMAEPVDFAGADLFGVDFASPPPPDLATAPVDAVSSASDLAMKAAAPANEPTWSCGCALGARPGRGAAVAAALLLALAVALARRRAGGA